MKIESVLSIMGSALLLAAPALLAQNTITNTNSLPLTQTAPRVSRSDQLP